LEYLTELTNIIALYRRLYNLSNVLLKSAITGENLRVFEISALTRAWNKGLDI